VTEYKGQKGGSWGRGQSYEFGVGSSEVRVGRV
jgi:hypothetical protein